MIRYTARLLLLLLAVSGAVSAIQASEQPFASFKLPSSQHVQGPVLLPESLKGQVLLIAEVSRDDAGRDAYRRLGEIGAEHESMLCILNLRLRAHMSEAYGFHQSASLPRGSRVSLYQNSNIPGGRPDDLPWLWIVAADGSLVWSGPAANGWSLIERMVAIPRGIIPAGRLWKHVEPAVLAINSDQPLAQTLTQLRQYVADAGEAAGEAQELLEIVTAWRDAVLADAVSERRLSEPAAVEAALNAAAQRLERDPLGEPFAEARKAFNSDRAVREAKRVEADLNRIVSVAEEHQLGTARADDPQNVQGRAQLARALEQFLRRHGDHPIAERAAALKQRWGL